MSPTKPLDSLKIEGFRRLWMGIVVFNVGHLVLVVASSWLVLEMTGSPLWVSAMVGAPTAPLLLLALPAGAVADLFDRATILRTSAATMMLAAGAMAYVGFSGVDSPALLVGLGVLVGVGVAFFNPAWQAIVPELVPQHLVPGAIALNSASGGVATALGPALGGVLVANFGPAWSFVAAVVGYGAMLATSHASSSTTSSQDVDTVPVAIASGIRYLRFSDGYLVLLLLGSCFGFTSAALRAMLPNLTSESLAGGATLYGLLLGVFGAGAMIGGLTRGHGSRLFGRRMLPFSIFAFGVSGIVVGALPELGFVFAGVAISGLLWTWILATMNSVFQMLTPDWVRGRTMAAFVLAVFGILPVGAIAAGALGDLVGAAGAVVLFSASVSVVGLIALRMDLPVLEEIVPPVTVPRPHALGAAPPSSEGPVMVVGTWTIETEDDREHFDLVLAELRRVRLATGAFRWNAYRSLDDPSRISETYVVHSWEHHLQLEDRLDLKAKEIIDEAERYGLRNQRITTHLVELDVSSESGRRRNAPDINGPPARPEH